MRKNSLLVAAGLALAVAIPSATADATPPADVEIVIETTISDAGGSGPFFAFGPAVDDGVFCETGFSSDLPRTKSSGGNAQGINLQVFKKLECDDESGSVTLKLQVRIDRKGNNFNWNIVEGTGDYERLHGTGEGFGIFLGPNPEGNDQILDILDGKMHID